MTAGPGCVFLLTDYGVVDEFAGLVRAAVLRAAPSAPVVDLTHGVAPFDVAGGAHTLRRCVAHLGPGVVVAVVDPGVGTGRRPVAVEVAAGAGPRALVGPDNGLLLPAADALGGVRRAVVLPGPPGTGTTTFDGRDVFAPAAARLWAGADLAALGVAVDPASLVRLPAARCRVGDGLLEVEVVGVDRFGNVELAAGPADADAAGLGAALVVAAGPAPGRPLRRVRSFAEVGGPGAGQPAPLGLLVDAGGHLALVCDRRPAAGELGLRVGDVVVVHDADRPPPPGTPPGPGGGGDGRGGGRR